VRFRFIVLATSVLGMWAIPCPAAWASNTGISYVVVSPDEGRAQSIVYLSGVGFPPNELELITIACPRATNANDGLESFLGPKTDAHGQFVRFKFNMLQPADTSKRVTCTVYASVGDNDFGTDILTTYIIVPPAESLDPRATRITGVSVQAAPLRVHAGLVERVAVHDPGWRGAQAVVQVKYPHMPLTTRVTKLDALGNASVKVTVAVRLGTHDPPVKASVRVRLRLGGYSGGGTTGFTVIH
jgi:hypothetical protein